MADKPNVLTPEQFNERMAQLQLQRAELENRRLLRDIEHMELGEQNLLTRAKQNAVTLAANKANANNEMSICTHRKGGKGLEAVKGGGKGNDPKFAVIKHRLPNGDVAVLCQRCPMIWLAPVQPKKTAKMTQQEFQAAAAKYKTDLREYRAALEFQTDNEESSSGLWVGGNFVNDAREQNHITAGH